MYYKGSTDAINAYATFMLSPIFLLYTLDHVH